MLPDVLLDAMDRAKIAFSIDRILGDQLDHQDRKSEPHREEADEFADSVSSSDETDDETNQGLQRDAVDGPSVSLTELTAPESVASWSRNLAFAGYLERGWLQPPVRPPFFTLQGRYSAVIKISINTRDWTLFLKLRNQWAANTGGPEPTASRGKLIAQSS